MPKQNTKPFDLETTAVYLDKKAKVLDKLAQDLEERIVKIANSAGDEQLKNLTNAVVCLRCMKGHWKGLRTVITGEATPLGSVPMPELEITEH